MTGIRTSLPTAIDTQNLEMLDQLIRDGIDPSINHNHAIIQSSEIGNVSIVDRLLLDPRVNPSGWRPISYAAKNGHLAVVARLLRDPRVNPSAKFNAALSEAAENGHLEVVELLLQDSRVTPSGMGLFAEPICLAAYNGHLPIVYRLLQDQRVDLSVDENWLIKWAIGKHNTDLVDKLLQDPRVYSTINTCDIDFTHISMIKSRSTEVCKALQDLELPALITLKILDTLIPNTIKMYAKWELITQVKHFHKNKD